MRICEHKFEPDIEHHSAQFYTCNADRVRGIADYLIEGIENGDAALLICSANNRTLVMDSLAGVLTPADHAKIEFADSAWASDVITVNGKVSESLFRSHVYSLVLQLIEKHGAVRVYGDIVNEMAIEGRDESVLDLELAWHKAIAETPFRLHCGYLLESFRSFKSSRLFEEVCHLHTTIHDETTQASKIQIDNNYIARELQISRAKVSQQLAAIEHESVLRDRLVSLGEMSATVSHELNGPLATILLSTENIRDWLVSEKLSDEQRASLEVHLRRTESSALRMMSINRSVLTFSRGSNAELGNFSLREPILKSSELLMSRLHGSGVGILVSLLPESVPLIVYGSSCGIEQVLLNLVNNSIDSIIERRVRDGNPGFNGHISIQLKLADDKYAGINVVDNGVGFSQDVQSRIFQPFFTTKPAGAGTGLGLAFSQKTIHQHGGKIEVFNRVDGGAEVRCLLPLACR